MLAPAATEENPELICTNYFLQRDEAAGKVKLSCSRRMVPW